MAKTTRSPNRWRTTTRQTTPSPCTSRPAAPRKASIPTRSRRAARTPRHDPQRATRVRHVLAGLACYEQGRYEIAIQNFQRKLDGWPNGHWTDGAVYNMARAYEAEGQWAKAIALYEDPREHAHQFEDAGPKAQAALSRAECRVAFEQESRTREEDLALRSRTCSRTPSPPKKSGE